jgi:hypothetical protein
MKLLVAQNTAGALTPVVDWLVDKGHSAKILVSQDIFALSSYSPNAQIFPRRLLYEKLIEHMFENSPDIIHINTAHILIPFVRLFTQRTPIVFMYHGSEARTRGNLGLSHRKEVLWADRIIVSTQDLIDFGDWFDRPIPSYFRYTGGRVKGSALMIYAEFFGKYGKDQRELARKVCDTLGLNLTIREKRNENPIPNNEMPKLYSQYEYYLDFKGLDTKETFALSKCALESMLCGCKVLQDSDPYCPVDSKEHLKGEELFVQYEAMYDSLEKSSYLFIIPRFIKAIGRIVMSPKSDPYGAVYRRPTLFGFVRLGYFALSFFKYVIRSLKK